MFFQNHISMMEIAIYITYYRDKLEIIVIFRKYFLNRSFFHIIVLLMVLLEFGTFFWDALLAWDAIIRQVFVTPN